MHKAIESPIIIHQAVTDLPLAPFFRGLSLVSFDDHLPLGKIADDHSPFSQSVGDELRSFMQTVALFAALLLGNPLVDVGEIDVPAGLFLALVAFGANLVELFVVPAIALEAPDVVETSLVAVAGCQGLDAQVKGDNTICPQGTVFAFLAPLVFLVVVIVFVLLSLVVDERAKIVATRISGYRHFVKVVRRVFGQMRHNIGVAFRPPVATSAGWQNDAVPLHLQVHGRITQGEKLMVRLEAREAWFLSGGQAAEEALHGSIQPIVDLG